MAAAEQLFLSTLRSSPSLHPFQDQPSPLCTAQGDSASLHSYPVLTTLLSFPLLSSLQALPHIPSPAGCPHLPLLLKASGAMKHSAQSRTGNFITHSHLAQTPNHLSQRHPEVSGGRLDPATPCFKTPSLKNHPLRQLSPLQSL